MKEKKMILGKDRFYSLNPFETHLNNNVLVVGASGAGKTRSVVIPNLLEAAGSYIISDPKGNLYKKYGKYMEMEGYEVKKLDFTDPENSAHYNFFNYIHSTQDIVKVAHMFIYQRKNWGHMDPFWDETSQLLMQACISYLREFSIRDERHLHNVLKLVAACDTKGDLELNETAMDKMMERLKKINSDSYAVSTYEKIRLSPDKTLRCILATLNGKLGAYDTPEISGMTAYDDIDIGSIGKKKTALFVVVSDTDRSMDGLVNIFFTQAMNELCRVADREYEDNALPVPVRFIMDDFATNCKIEEFPRMISSIRSRGISTMLMIQAESQLQERYGYDWKTIIANCDSYVYLGGNDVETAKSVAERSDVPVRKILNMPVGTNWIFRRGQEPVNGLNYDPEPLIARKKLLATNRMDLNSEGRCG